MHKDKRRLCVVSFGSTDPNFTHLLFVDDSLVFLEASQQKLMALWGVPQDYEVMSGPKC